MAGLLKSLFRRPKYRSYLLLGDSRVASSWACSYWTRYLFPGLNELVECCGCAPSIQCRQLTGPDSKEVKFGRLTWSMEDAQKWCHSPQEPSRGEWLFVDLQVFCPPRQQLVKEDELPTIYLQVKPVGRRDHERKAIYDEAVLIALEERFVSQNTALVDSVIAKLTGSPAFVALFVSTPTIPALNQFESFVREAFIYRGMHEDELPNVARMPGKWERASLNG